MLGKCFRKITMGGKIGSETQSSELRYKVHVKVEADNGKDQK